jgi:hypothetical protein
MGREEMPEHESLDCELYATIKYSESCHISAACPDMPFLKAELLAPEDDRWGRASF